MIFWWWPGRKISFHSSLFFDDNLPIRGMGRRQKSLPEFSFSGRESPKIIHVFSVLGRTIFTTNWHFLVKKLISNFLKIHRQGSEKRNEKMRSRTLIVDPDEKSRLPENGRNEKWGAGYGLLLMDRLVAGRQFFDETGGCGWADSGENRFIDF